MPWTGKALPTLMRSSKPRALPRLNSTIEPSRGSGDDLPSSLAIIAVSFVTVFKEQSISACMRFLCHGLVFETRDGQIVSLKAHSLRHVFATHARHVEQLPLDVIACILHQKNLEVTSYYAAPRWEQVVA